MSKKFKSQASSARATTAAFGNPSFGFGPTAPFQTSGSRLSYVTEQPDYSTISEPNVAVSFKNLSKKDSKTKEKALDDLNQYLSTLDGKASVDDAIIDAWVGSSSENVNKVVIIIHICLVQDISSSCCR